MTEEEQEGATEEEPQLDKDDPGEVGTSFATKGSGWSGRDEQE